MRTDLIHLIFRSTTQVENLTRKMGGKKDLARDLQMPFLLHHASHKLTSTSNPKLPPLSCKLVDSVVPDIPRGPHKKEAKSRNKDSASRSHAHPGRSTNKTSRPPPRNKETKRQESLSSVRPRGPFFLFSCLGRAPKSGTGES